MHRHNTRVETEKAAVATSQWPSLVFGLFAILVAGFVCIKDFQTRELPMADQTAVERPDEGRADPDDGSTVSTAAPG